MTVSKPQVCSTIGAWLGRFVGAFGLRVSDGVGWVGKAFSVLFKLEAASDDELSLGTVARVGFRRRLPRLGPEQGVRLGVLPVTGPVIPFLPMHQSRRATESIEAIAQMRNETGDVVAQEQ